MKNKNLLKILIVIVIVSIVICIFTILNYIRNNEIKYGTYTKKDLEIIDKEVKKYMSNKITPKGISKLHGKYKGDNNINEIYISLYNFVNYLPKLSKQIEYDNKQSIISYYENNKEEILTNTGLSKEESFIEFVEYLKSINYKGEKYVDSQIDDSSYNIGKKYFSLDIEFHFENFDNIFKIKLNFANSTTTKPLVYYSIIKNDN